MEKNLKILILKDFMISMGLSVNFRLLELPNKMRLLKGKKNFAINEKNHVS